MAKQTKPSWSRVKAQLKDWDKAQLTGLIQDRFSHSRVLAGDIGPSRNAGTAAGPRGDRHGIHLRIRRHQ